MERVEREGTSPPDLPEIEPLVGNPLEAEGLAVRSISGKQEYMDIVDQAKEHIFAGDIFEICTTHRLDCNFDGDPWELYEELRRGKENVKGRLVLSSESTAARMTRISRATLFGLPIDSLDEMLAKVEAVTVDDLTELATELYAPERLSAACVGRDEDRFRKALAPISGALVAA